MQDRPSALVWATRLFVALLVVTTGLTVLRSDRRSAADVGHTDGTVWLVSPTAGTAALINSATMEISAEVKIANPGEPVEAVQFGSDALVLNRATGELGLLDGTRLTYGPTTSMGGSGADLEILAAGGQPYVLNAGEGWVRAIDPLTLNPLGSADISPGVTSAEVDDHGRLWLVDRIAGQVSMIDETGRRASSELGGRNNRLSIVLAGGAAYAADPANAVVVSLDDEVRPGNTYCLPEPVDAVVGAGTGPGSDPSLIYSVAPNDASQSRLFITDVTEGRCRPVDLGDPNADYGEPVTAGTVAFIPLVGGGRVLVVSTTDDGDRVKTVRVVPESERFELFVKDQTVWFNNLTGPEAGTIDAFGRVLRLAKFDDGDPLFGSQAAGDGSRIDDSLVGTGENGDASGSLADEPDTGTDLGSPQPPPSPNDSILRDDARPAAVTTPGAPDTIGDSRSEDSTTDDPLEGDADGEPEPNVEPDPFSPEFDDIENPLSVIPEGERDESAPEPPSVAARVEGSTVPAPPPARNEAEAAGRGERTDGVVVSGPRPGESATLEDAPLQPSPDTVPGTAGRAGQLRAHFEVSTTVVEVGQSVSFTDLSSGSPTAWSWDFGDGSSASGPTARNVWPAAGTFTVTLTVSDGSRTDSKTTSIVVIDPARPTPPAANFTYTSETAEVGEEIVFRDQSAGSPTEWLWDWGDGDTSSGRRSSHSWSRSGSYTVRLLVRNDQGSDEARFRVTIIDKVLSPTASFEVSSEIVTVKEIIAFTSTSTGNPTNLIWDFGDGTSGIGPRVTHSYDRPAQYTVRLVISNSKGQAQFERQVVVRSPTEPPDARFTVSDTQVGVGVPVLFTDASLGSPDSIMWDFGDGVTSAGSSVSHAWSRPGAYRVRLIVTNEAGRSENDVAINVVDAARRPVARFTRVPSTPVQIGESISFVDNSGNGAIAWSWDFGDGTTSTDQNPTHAYRAAGTYVVTFTASNDRGTHSRTGTVTVRDGEIEPSAAFVFSPLSPAVGNELAFEDRSTSNTVSWLWDFGDGSTSSTQNPVYVYASPGTYLVTLTAANGSGSDSAQQTVTVRSSSRPQPSGAFDWIPSNPIAGERVTFVDFTPGTITTPIWSFPGGEVPSDPGRRDIDFTFENSGVYQIGMRVCWVDEPNNCRLRTRTVRVAPPSTAPVAGFEIGGGIIDQATVRRGEIVIFSETASGSDIAEPRWVIDGAPFAGSEVERVFASTGPVDVQLTVENGVGVDVVTRTIQVIDPLPPDAAFTVSANPVEEGTAVSFTDRTSGVAQGWRWDFGDGATSANQNPDHTFAAGGTYLVTLEVTNQWGTDSTSRSVQVIPIGSLPDPEINLLDPFGSGGQIPLPATMPAGQVFVAEDLAAPSDDSTSWLWDYGDGTTESGRQVSHFYNTPGTYELTLTVTNSVGSTSVTVMVTAL